VRDGVVSRPALFERLARAQRVVQVSAQAGSGKTVLLRSWIAESGLAKRVAWVPVSGERSRRHPAWTAGRWSSGCLKTSPRSMTRSGW
jgi:LuxR family maltose regulon positive regulatory protein